MACHTNVSARHESAEDESAPITEVVAKALLLLVGKHGEPWQRIAVAAAYFRRQSQASRRFFRDIMGDARVERLLDEIATVVSRWYEQHRTGDREAFDRMQLMRSSEFARAEAGKLRDLVATSALQAGITIH